MIGVAAMPAAGPGVRAQPVRADAIRPDTEQDVVLEELSVVGTGVPVETATGPVVGYRATRSASATRTDTVLCSNLT